MQFIKYSMVYSVNLYLALIPKVSQNNINCLWINYQLNQKSIFQGILVDK